MQNSAAQQQASDRVGAILLLGIAVIMGGAYVAGAELLMLPGVAAVCLIAFALTREYGLAIASGVMGGIGTAIVLAAYVVGEAAAGPAFLLSFAGGFAAVWLLGLVSRPVEAHPWPLAPAGVFAVIGLSAAFDAPILADALPLAGAVVLAAVGLVALLRRGR